MIFGAAVQSRSEDAGDCGFADAAMSAENIAVGRASLLDGILQGAGDVLLSDDLRKLLGTVFAGQDGITHEDEESIIRDVVRLRDRSRPATRRGGKKRNHQGCTASGHAVGWFRAF